MQSLFYHAYVRTYVLLLRVPDDPGLLFLCVVALLGGLCVLWMMYRLYRMVSGLGFRFVMRRQTKNAIPYSVIASYLQLLCPRQC